MDIAAVAMNMKSTQIANEASMLMLKNVMDMTEQTSAQLLDALLSLPVGGSSPARLDISI